MSRLAATRIGQVYLPLITVRLVAETPVGTAELLPFAMLDSGADTTLIPAEVMEALGVAWSTIPAAGQVGGGAGGQFETRVALGFVEWDGMRICNSLLVAAPGSLPGPLLGRADFFTKCSVRFNWHRVPPDFDVAQLLAPRRIRRASKRK